MDSVLNLGDEAPSQLDMARALLIPRPKRDPAWPALLAATLFAMSGLGFAFAAITAQPAEFKPVPQVSSEKP